MTTATPPRWDMTPIFPGLDSPEFAAALQDAQTQIADYMFGLLFGLGLFARYQQDPDGFRAGYDDLLASTGLADAATQAGHFGIDLRAPAFWRGSLDVIRADIARFVALV